MTVNTSQKRGGERGRGKSKYHFGHPDYVGPFFWFKPRMDWDKIRRQKSHFCHNCPYRDQLLLGCHFGFVLDKGASEKVQRT